MDGRHQGPPGRLRAEDALTRGRAIGATLVAREDRDLYMFIDDKHRIAHNKIMVIDGKTVITGSFNFTKGAESENAENLLVIQGKELAKAYTENWQAHLKHSAEYQGR